MARGLRYPLPLPTPHGKTEETDDVRRPPDVHSAIPPFKPPFSGASSISFAP